MPFIHDSVKDNGLVIATGSNKRIDITHTEAATYTEATVNFTVAYKNGAVTSLVNGIIDGRSIQVNAISDGTVTVTSTGPANDGQYWALSDTATQMLLASGPLEEAQYVTSGNTFVLSQFEAINFSDPL